MLSKRVVSRTVILCVFVGISLLAVAAPVSADKTFSMNKQANKLYEQENYESALEFYDKALLESPGNNKLKMNKGSALYKMEQYDKAAQEFSDATGVEGEGARADLHYNMGNTLFRQGQQMAMQGNQNALETFKSAREHYITALDNRPEDIDTKWNLQLTNAVIEKLKQQQQQQQQQKNDQNKKDDKNKQDQKQQQQDKNNQQQQDTQKQEQEKQQEQPQKQQEKDRQQQQQEQKQQSAQQQKEHEKREMEKREAQRLLMQFSDDADELNKPRKKIPAGAKKPEKDW
jgi:Ca-activated chloride channel family protein